MMVTHQVDSVTWKTDHQRERIKHLSCLSGKTHLQDNQIVDMRTFLYIKGLEPKIKKKSRRNDEIRLSPLQFLMK